MLMVQLLNFAVPGASLAGSGWNNDDVLSDGAVSSVSSASVFLFPLKILET